MRARWSARIVLAGVAAAMAAGAEAQEQDRLFLPPLWDDEAVVDTVEDGPGGDEPDTDPEARPVEPGVAGAGGGAPDHAAGTVSDTFRQERTELEPAAAVPEEAAISGGVHAERETVEGTDSSSLLKYLGDRKEAVRPVAPAPGLTGAAAALFGCPRSVLEDLLMAATAKADVVSSLEIEREVLTLCGERQALVVKILQAEGELTRLWQESRGPAPEEARPKPADVLEQLTEFEGAEVVEFVQEGESLVSKHLVFAVVWTGGCWWAANHMRRAERLMADHPDLFAAKLLRGEAPQRDRSKRRRRI